MRPRISIRGRVRPLVRPFVRNAFVKSDKNRIVLAIDYSKTTSKVRIKVFSTCPEDLFVHPFNRQMMTHRCTQWVLVSSTCPFGCWSGEGCERLCEINGERQSWSMRQRQKERQRQGCGQSVLLQLLPPTSFARDPEALQRDRWTIELTIQCIGFCLHDECMTDKRMVGRTETLL